MSLQEAIEDLKKEIAIKGEEPEVVEDEVEEQEEETVDPEIKDEEPAKEEVEEKKEEPDASGYARLRREAAAEKKRATALETRNAELEAKLAGPAEIEAIPTELYAPEIQEVLADNRMRKAEREFEALEASFRATNPDYDAVAGQYAQALAHSIKIQNPRLGGADIAERTKQALLQKAGAHVRAGFDPIEELYHEAKELGFTGKQAAKEEKVEEELKPDMAKLATNRRKSAGMTASTGKSEGIMTKQAASELTVAEWAKLPATEKRRLLSS